MEQITASSLWQKDQESGVFYGKPQGFWASVHPAGMGKLTLAFASDPCPAPEEIQRCFEELGADGLSYHLSPRENAPHSIQIVLKYKNITKKKEAIHDGKLFLEKLAACAQETAKQPCCEQCGAKTGPGFYLRGERGQSLCALCAEKENAEAEQAAQKHRRGNWVAAVSAALLGAMAGSALWIFTNQWGLLAGITGFAMAFLVMKAFAFGGGKFHTGGIFFCTALSVLALAASEAVCLGHSIFLAFGAEGYPFWDCVKAVPVFLQFPEIRAGVLGKMAVGYLFMAAGSFAALRGMTQKELAARGLVCLEPAEAAQPMDDEAKTEEEPLSGAPETAEETEADDEKNR